MNPNRDGGLSRRAFVKAAVAIGGSAALSRDGDAAFEEDLTDTLHPELGYHYGTVVDGVGAGDTLRIAVDASPQVARHETYETAFVEMDPVEVTA